jgi:hypothetical protein
MGSRRQIAKLSDLGQEATELLAGARDDTERLDLRTTTVAGFPFDAFQDGRMHRVLVNVGDFVPNKKGRSNLQPGPGRRPAEETARDELTKFLRWVGLSERATAEVTRDVFRWYLGKAIEAPAVRKRQERARRRRKG